MHSAGVDYSAMTGQSRVRVNQLRVIRTVVNGCQDTLQLKRLSRDYSWIFG